VQRLSPHWGGGGGAGNKSAGAQLKQQGVQSPSSPLINIPQSEAK